MFLVCLLENWRKYFNLKFWYFSYCDFSSDVSFPVAHFVSFLLYMLRHITRLYFCVVIILQRLLLYPRSSNYYSQHYL